MQNPGRFRFDDTMDRLEGAYKRWSKWVLFVVALVIATGLNISAVRIVNSLWNDATLRSAVADVVVEIDDRPCPGTTDTDKQTCQPEEKIEKAIGDLDGLKLPIGWGGASKWDFVEYLLVGIGIFITAAAAMLGGPFWFDLITRLAGARGGVPAKAADDAGSATVESRTLVGSTRRKLSDL